MGRDHDEKLRLEIAKDEALRREMWERGEVADRPTSPRPLPDGGPDPYPHCKLAAEGLGEDERLRRELFGVGGCCTGGGGIGTVGAQPREALVRGVFDAMTSVVYFESKAKHAADLPLTPDVEKRVVGEFPQFMEGRHWEEWKEEAARHSDEELRGMLRHWEGQLEEHSRGAEGLDVITPDAVERITKAIERQLLALHEVGGEDCLFIDLGEPRQRETLKHHVYWEGLSDEQVGYVVANVIKDVREKVPEEIYPRRWFDAVAIDGRDKVIGLDAAKRQLGGWEREVSLDDRAVPAFHWPGPEQGQAPGEDAGCTDEELGTGLFEARPGGGRLPDGQSIARMLDGVEAVTKGRFYEDPDPVAGPVEMFMVRDGGPAGEPFGELSVQEKFQVLGDYTDWQDYEGKGVSFEQMDQVFRNVIEGKPREGWLDGTGLAADEELRKGLFEARPDGRRQEREQGQTQDQGPDRGGRRRR